MCGKAAMRVPSSSVRKIYTKLNVSANLVIPSRNPYFLIYSVTANCGASYSSKELKII